MGSSIQIRLNALLNRASDARQCCYLISRPSSVDPFKAYIGKTVLLRHSLFVIVRSEVHGREIRFIIRQAGSTAEIAASLVEILDGELEAMVA